MACDSGLDFWVERTLGLDLDNNLVVVVVVAHPAEHFPHSLDQKMTFGYRILELGSRANLYGYFDIETNSEIGTDIRSDPSDARQYSSPYVT